jgi:hypothetical protein
MAVSEALPWPEYEQTARVSHGGTRWYAYLHDWLRKLLTDDSRLQSKP